MENNDTGIAVFCLHCKIEYKIRRNEYNRKIKKSQNFFCSLKCTGEYRRVFRPREEKATCYKCNTEFSYFRTDRDYKKKTCGANKCLYSREHSEETREQVSLTLKGYYSIPENIERLHKQLEKQNSNNSRFSSKAERALADALAPHGFKRHKLIRTESGLAFDVDICHIERKIWVESDGEWHFRKVHEGHDFEKTQLRDKIEEEEAIKRGVLLIRIDNRKTEVDEQVKLVLDTIESWDGQGTIIKF